MATKTSLFYKDAAFASGDVSRIRRLDAYIDFTNAANQTAALGDDLKLFRIPVGTYVLGGGIEQLVAGTTSNTYTARLGTIALSSTLAGDAAVGTFTTQATYALDGNAGTLTIPPYLVATAVDFNLLSAGAIRTAGRARAFLFLIEGETPVNFPSLAQRDGSL